MKKIIIITLFLFGALLGSSQLFAQGPPPPPDGHGGTDNEPPGGGAPTSGGLILFLAFSVGYGGIKLYKLTTLKVENEKSMIL